MSPAQKLAAPQATYWPPAVAQRQFTVLVADPNGVANAALRPALIEFAGCRVVEATSFGAVAEIVAGEAPGDLAMVSIRFRAHTTSVIRALRKNGWRRIIVLAPPMADVTPVLAAVEAGASGVLNVPGLDAIAPGDPITNPAHGLTEREVEVIRLVAEGMSNKEIGVRMELSALTIKSHLARIGKRLGVGDRAHMVAIACRAGILPAHVPVGVR
jgi:DNA-binding NarL/FixJ family response regulator